MRLRAGGIAIVRFRRLRVPVRLRVVVLLMISLVIGVVVVLPRGSVTWVGVVLLLSPVVRIVVLAVRHAGILLLIKLSKNARRL